jgi:phage replication initiation protein
MNLVKVDWLNATFAQPAMSVEGFIAFLAKLFGRPTTGEAGRGLFGFQTGVKLRCYLGGAMVDVGSIAYGGESQRGRWMFQLTGKGCGLLQDWEAAREFLEGLDARLTRVDLAADFLNGEHTVDEAVKMHAEGGFTNGGRPPSTEVAGDWLEGVRGRTLYIGKGTNGKMLRVYEKGRQLGDLDSMWTRFEVQLGNRDRDIPMDVLTDRDAFFGGCYPALASLVADAAQRIPTTRTESKTTLGHLLYHARRSYGKLFDVLAKTVGADHTDLVEEIRIVGIPRRVNPSGLVAGLEWAQVKAQVRKALT